MSSFLEMLGNAMMEGGSYGMGQMGYDDSFSLLDKAKRQPEQQRQETEGWSGSDMLPGYGIQNLAKFLENRMPQPMGQYANFLGQGTNQWRS